MAAAASGTKGAVSWKLVRTRALRKGDCRCGRADHKAGHHATDWRPRVPIGIALEGCRPSMAFHALGPSDRVFRGFADERY